MNDDRCQQQDLVRISVSSALTRTSSLVRRGLDELADTLKQAEEVAALALLEYESQGADLEYDERFEEAEALYREAVQFFPTEASLHVSHGKALSGLERFDEAQQAFVEAEALYRQQIHNSPEKARFPLGLGALLVHLEKFENAECVYREATHAFADEARFHNALGDLYVRLERFHEAEVEYREALRIDPSYRSPLYRLTRLLKNQDRHTDVWTLYQDLETRLRHAIELEPASSSRSSRRKHVALGHVLDRQEEYLQAECVYRNALDVFSGDRFLRHRLRGVIIRNARQLIRDGAYMLAEAWCTEAIEIDPDSAQGYQVLGEVLIRQARFSEAEAALRAGLLRGPHSEDTRDVLIRVLWQQGKHIEAEIEEDLLRQVVAEEAEAEDVVKNE